MQEKLEADQVLDTKGMLCPIPVLKTNQTMKALTPGQILQVLATDPASKPDLAAWSRTSGNEILHVLEQDESPKVYVFYIRKK